VVADSASFFTTPKSINMYYINIYLFKLNVHTNAFNDTGTKVHSNHTGCKSSWLNFSKGQEENLNPLDASLDPLCSEIVEVGLITCSVENVALSMKAGKVAIMKLQS
jgi:hypothetical protein